MCGLEQVIVVRLGRRADVASALLGLPLGSVLSWLKSRSLNEGSIVD